MKFDVQEYLFISKTSPFGDIKTRKQIWRAVDPFPDKTLSIIA